MRLVVAHGPHCSLAHRRFGAAGVGRFNGATGALPDGLSFVDNGDGTASLSGTTTMEPGSVSIVLTSSNGVADAVQTLEIDVTAAPAVALPLVVPSGHGHLTGVPSMADAGVQLDVGADGFSPGATVTFGIYSARSCWLAHLRADGGPVASADASPVQETRRKDSGSPG